MIKAEVVTTIITDTSKRIVVNNGDGSVSIIIPLDCGLTVEQIAVKDVPPGLSYRIVDASALPSDRTFRDAWTDDEPTETVDVHVERAKEIKRRHIRGLRDTELAKADIEVMKAIEAGDGDLIKQIAARKKALRDATKHLPDDIEQLKNYIPKILR